MTYRKLIYTSIVLAGGVTLAACSTTPAPNANLNQAKSAVAAAQADPLAKTSAPYKLQDAQEALNDAQKAWSDNEDKSVVDHNAYLAQRYAQTAMEVAKARTNMAETANAAREITLPGMLFKVGKADLNDQGMKAVGDIANFMRTRADRSVEVMGYTDSTGSAKLNAALSAARADAVKTALVKEGIDPARIVTKGLGPSNPVASNDTAAGRQQNRRVVIDISAPGGAGVGSSAPSN